MVRVLAFVVACVSAIAGLVGCAGSMVHQNTLKYHGKATLSIVHRSGKIALESGEMNEELRDNGATLSGTMNGGLDELALRSASTAPYDAGAAGFTIIGMRSDDTWGASALRFAP